MKLRSTLLRDIARKRLQRGQLPPTAEEIEAARWQGYQIVMVDNLEMWIRDYSLDVEEDPR